MKVIKFNDAIFAMPYNVVVEGNSIRVEVLKEEHTLPEIMPLISGVEEIQVLDNNEVIAVYTGYTDVICLQIFSDYPIGLESTGYVISMVLSNADMQAQINNLSQQVSLVNEAQEQLGNRVDDLTPYIDTKKGYYGETEKTFYNVPIGNVSVFFDNYNGSYSVNRTEDRLIVSFDALEEETNITISVQ